MRDALADFRTLVARVGQLPAELVGRKQTLEGDLLILQARVRETQSAIAEIDAGIAKLAEVAKVVSPKVEPPGGEGPIEVKETPQNTDAFSAARDAFSAARVVAENARLKAEAEEVAKELRAQGPLE